MKRITASSISFLACIVSYGQTELTIKAGPSFSWIGQNAVSNYADADIGTGLGGWALGASLRLPWPSKTYYHSGLVADLNLQHRTFNLVETLEGQKNRTVRDVDVWANSVELYAGPWLAITEDARWWFSVGPCASFTANSDQEGTLSSFVAEKLTKGPEVINGSASGILNDVSFSLRSQLHWKKKLSGKFDLDASIMLSRSFTSPLVDVSALHFWDAHLMAGISYVFPVRARPGESDSGSSGP